MKAKSFHAQIVDPHFHRKEAFGYIKRQFMKAIGFHAHIVDPNSLRKQAFSHTLKESMKVKRFKTHIAFTSTKQLKKGSLKKHIKLNHVS